MNGNGLDQQQPVNIEAEVQQALGGMQIQMMILQKQIAALQAENAELRDQLPPKPAAPGKGKELPQ